MRSNLFGFCSISASPMRLPASIRVVADVEKNIRILWRNKVELMKLDTMDMVLLRGKVINQDFSSRTFKPSVSRSVWLGTAFAGGADG